MGIPTPSTSSRRQRPPTASDLRRFGPPPWTGPRPTDRARARNTPDNQRGQRGGSLPAGPGGGLPGSHVPRRGEPTHEDPLSRVLRLAVRKKGSNRQDQIGEVSREVGLHDQAPPQPEVREL